MIKLLKQGKYRLIETKAHKKILTLGANDYAWVNAIEIGEILVASHNPHIVDAILSVGNYWLYDVKDDPELTDLQHLELEVGPNTIQGFLLLTGLPTSKKKRSRIIPTNQLVGNKSKQGKTT